MSAAAYISRAHASALAASAQRRSQQHQGHQNNQQLTTAASVEGYLSAVSHQGSLAGDNAPIQGGAYVSLQPCLGGPIEVSGFATEGSGSLLNKRPRTSST